MTAEDEKADSTTAASDHIARLPAELLENVLLRVDEKTLLLSQRVSKQFQAAIAGSARIQEKLFFRQPREGTNQVTLHNPLLPWRFIERREKFPEPVTRGFGFALDVETHHRIDPLRPKVTIDFDSVEGWYGDGSWRRMYLLRGGTIAGLYAIARWKGEYLRTLDEVGSYMGSVLSLSSLHCKDVGTMTLKLGQLFGAALERAINRGLASKNAAVGGCKTNSG